MVEAAEARHADVNIVRFDIQEMNDDSREQDCHPGSREISGYVQVVEIIGDAGYLNCGIPNFLTREVLKFYFRVGIRGGG